MAVRTNLMAAAGAALAALAGLLVVQRLGTVAVVLAGAGVVGVALLARPAVAVGLLAVLVVLLESRADYVAWEGQTRLYAFVGPSVTGLEVLVGVAAAAVLLRASARGRVLLPEPLAIPLVLLLVAALSGVVTGLAAGAQPGEVVDAVRLILPLVVVPLVVVNLLDTVARVRTAIVLVAWLVALKCALGLLLVFGGLTPTADEAFSITFYEAPANLLAMVFVLAGVAALVARVPTPVLLRVGVAICFASLLFSFRRSFWVGTVAALLLLVLLATNQSGRRLVVPAGLVLLAAAALLLSSSAGAQLDGPVGTRINQLRPSEIRGSDQDRYRLTEQRNVRAVLRDDPVTGLGLAVPWPARYPLSLENAGGRNYAHFAMTWWWLKCGVLGLLAYLAVMGTAIVSAVRSFRLVADPLVRVAALGIGTGLVGLFVAELTATFAGPDARMSVVLGGLLGLVAAIHRTRAGASGS